MVRSERPALQECLNLPQGIRLAESVLRLELQCEVVAVRHGGDLFLGDPVPPGLNFVPNDPFGVGNLAGGNRSFESHGHFSKMSC